MQTTSYRWALPACQAIYNDPALPAGDKLEAMGHILGFGHLAAAQRAANVRHFAAINTPTTANTSAARGGRTPQTRTRTSRTATPQPTTRASRGTKTTETPLGEQVYARIPATGDIRQKRLTELMDSIKPHTIGRALSRLEKAGRIVSHGAGEAKTWARNLAAEQQADLRRAA